MNGLSVVQTKNINYEEMDMKDTYLDVFDSLFGARMLANALDNFYEWMIDAPTIEILNEEILKLVELVVSTKSKGVVATIPCKVVLEGKDVLIKAVGHRRVLVTDIHSTIAYIVNSYRRSCCTRATTIANTNV